MTHSGTRRILSLSAYGLLAGGLFLAGGIAAASQKEKPSEPESEPTTQPSSTEMGTSLTSLKTGKSDYQIPNTPQARSLARKMVAKQSHCLDDEYMLLEELGLL